MSLDFLPALRKLESLASATGLFERVNRHEPKNAPGNGLSVGIWLQSINPVPSESGQNATTGRVIFTLRIFRPALMEPLDDIDPDVGHAAGRVMEQLSGDFELGANVKYVDLLGATGTALSLQMGYLTIGNTPYRIGDITIPLVINDIWAQEG